MKKLLLILLFSTISIFTLNGCGGPSSTGQSSFTPIRPDSTSTPTAVAADSAPPGTPTSVVPEQVPINTYTHSTNRFSIDHPDNWQALEQPDGVVFVEPGGQAEYRILFSDAGESYSEEELNRFLVTFVAANFADEDSGFKAIDQENNSDGSMVAKFTSTDPKLGRIITEVQVWQKDTIVLTLILRVTEEQWQISQQKLENLVDTLTLLDTSPIVQPTPTEEPPIWVLIGSTNNDFGFFYPSDWKILRQDEEVVTVAMPDFEVEFEGSVSTAGGSGSRNDSIKKAEQAALTFIETLSAENSDVQNLPPTEFPLDTVTGVTVDFLYTTQNGTDMAGSVIAAVSEDKIYRVVFTAPAEFYEAALQWFNPMYKSFKILPAEDLVVE